MEETKPVHEIIEDVKAEICDNYCKYTDGYKEAQGSAFNQYP